MPRLRTWLSLFALMGIIPIFCSPTFRRGFAAPMVNDISTDLDSPPVFTTPRAGQLPSSFIPTIKKYYPDVQPLVVRNRGVDDVFNVANDIATGTKGWAVSRSDLEAKVIQGVAVTPLFRFTDDWVVRLSVVESSEPGGEAAVRVDMRSKSRVGKSDMGANAARIKDYLKRLEANF